METSVADWSLQQSPDSRADVITLGQSALRIGVSNHAEVAIGWVPFATARIRNNATGLISHQSGIGDLTLAAKRSFGNPDDPHVAVKAYGSIPIGSGPAAAGNWSVGMQLPVVLEFGSAAQFSLTPEADATTNSSGSGHHFAYGGAAGLGVKLSEKLSLGMDIRILRDDDPGGLATKASAGLSIALQQGNSLQFDVGGNLGLNRNVPDAEFCLGLSKRF